MTNATQTTMASALATAGAVINGSPAKAFASTAQGPDRVQQAAQTNYRYFDLIEYIDGIDNVHLKEHMFGYMAWRIDSFAVTALRAVAREIFLSYIERPDAPSIDAFSEFMRVLRAAEFNESMLRDMGLNDVTSYSSARALIGMRNQWHEAADRTSSRTYTPKSLHEQIVLEKVQQVTPDMRAKIAVDVKWATRTCPERFDEMMAVAEKAKNQQFATFYKNKAVNNDLIIKLVGYFQNKASLLEESDLQFYNLPVEMKARLIEAAALGVDKAFAKLGDDSRVPVHQYIEARVEGDNLQKQLLTILKAPAFKSSSLDD